jgi:hypothetical protein
MPTCIPFVGAVRYIAERAKDMGAKLVFAMDGHRSAIYLGVGASPALELNRLAAQAAADRSSMPSLCSGPIGRRTTGSTSTATTIGTRHGHEVAAKAIGSALDSLGRAAPR